jgi:hypothetical protein
MKDFVPVWSARGGRSRGTLGGYSFSDRMGKEPSDGLARGSF